MPPPADEERRPILLAVFVGVAIAAAAFAVIISIVAIPLFALAAFGEPGRALDRPIMRSTIRLAIPVAVVLGLISGAGVARWYRRGGHLPREWE